MILCNWVDGLNKGGVSKTTTTFHGADEFILVSGMEEAVLIYMEAIKNLLAI